MELIEHLGTRQSSFSTRNGWSLFKCPACGNHVERPTSNGKKCKTCGCGRYKKHGMSRSRIYKSWEDMKKRCMNERCKSYKRYGGRGISVCAEWMEFLPFLDWALKNGYSDDLEIDRRNNDGNYEPGNVRFVKRAINQRNKSTVKLNEKNVNLIRWWLKTKLPKKEIAKMFNVDARTISSVALGRTWS